jgi:transposase
MRYELADYEWAAIRSFLPKKSRSVPRVSDRRVLSGIFWILRSGAPWRDVYWNTHETNATARSLYDKVATRSGFSQYRKDV